MVEVFLQEHPAEEAANRFYDLARKERGTPVGRKAARRAKSLREAAKYIP